MCFILSMNGTSRYTVSAAFLAIAFFAATSHADARLNKKAIWAACWAGETTYRKLKYPYPIKVSIQNRGTRDITVCVYDNRCPYTMFKGRLRPKHTKYLSACADKRKRGSLDDRVSDTVGEGRAVVMFSPPTSLVTRRHHDQSPEHT